MEYLRSIAEIEFFGDSVKNQELARELFDTIDKDKSGEVDISELKQFLRKFNLEDYATDLFEKLDKDGNGRLSFLEARTLYYIIQSGRPFCDGCKKLVTDAYFACVDCFGNSTPGGYHVCPSCYKNRNFKHSHGDNHPPVFMDNYTLLHKCSALNLKRTRTNLERVSMAVDVGSTIVDVGSTIASCSIM